MTTLLVTLDSDVSAFGEATEAERRRLLSQWKERVESALAARFDLDIEVRYGSRFGVERLDAAGATEADLLAERPASGWSDMTLDVRSVVDDAWDAWCAAGLTP